MGPSSQIMMHFWVRWVTCVYIGSIIVTTQEGNINNLSSKLEKYVHSWVQGGLSLDVASRLSHSWSWPLELGCLATWSGSHARAAALIWILTSQQITPSLVVIIILYSCRSQIHGYQSCWHYICYVCNTRRSSKRFIRWYVLCLHLHLAITITSKMDG